MDKDPSAELTAHQALLLAAAAAQEIAGSDEPLLSATAAGCGAIEAYERTLALLIPSQHEAEEAA
jgi:hypothetical protein